jgi:excisionase family DNA binding protein
MVRKGNKQDKKELATTLTAAPRLLTVQEFCARAGMSVEWGRKQVQLRTLDAVRIGKRSVRIPSSELDRIIAENLVPARTVAR